MCKAGPAARAETAVKHNKILQFGEGVFLRGFPDALVERMNRESDFHGEVYAVKPRPGAVQEAFAAQDCRYHLLVRGVADDGTLVERLEEITSLKRVYSSSDEWGEIEKLAADPELRFVFSNTTEAGIAYDENNPDTFPGKLARLLRKRFQAGLPGVVVLPFELIEHNGETLRNYVLRYLAGEPAAEYVRKECRFFDTLVDRIVSGFPADAAQFDPDDRLMVAAEPFAFLALQAPEALREILPLPADTVFCVPDIAPYRTRKVRLLNASHTAMVAGGLLAGFQEVGELLETPVFRKRIESTLYDEILPTVPLPEREKRSFADAVLRRFANPFAHHKLASIALNSAAKWRVRVLPVILDSAVLPRYLARSFGELYSYYRRSGAAGDTAAVAARFAGEYPFEAFLSDRELWGMDLSSIPGFADAAREALQ